MPAPPKGHIARRIAASVLPKTQRSLAEDIYQQRRLVTQLRDQLPQSRSADQLSLRRRIAQESRKLAELIASGRLKQSRAKKGLPAGTRKISPEDLKKAKAAVELQLSETKKGLKTSSKLSHRGPLEIRGQALAAGRALTTRKALLDRRLVLLKQGLDIVPARRLAPADVGKQRATLSVPALYTVPTPGHAALTIRLLATQVPRKANETPDEFLTRLRTYTQRSLVRLVNKRARAGLSAASAIQLSVAETLRDDTEAIEAEARAGGVVADPIAETMDIAIIPVEEQLQAAVEDLAPLAPSAPPSMEETDLLLVEAESTEAELKQAPEEPMDKIRAGVLDDVTPWYQNPAVWVGGLVVAGLLWTTTNTGEK